MGRASVTVVIPACDEEAVLPTCLGALLASRDPGCFVEIIVAANGCRDATAAVARTHAALAEARGWTLTVLDDPQGGKTRALNVAESAASGAMLVYLDADVTLSPNLLAGLVQSLAQEVPAYASGQLRMTARGPVSRAYARTWARVPFMASGVPGCGLFAVNAAGRARWGAWPDIISDDTFARLHFAPHERHLVLEPYDWPVVEGLAALVRVRRRQDRGVAEIVERFPRLLDNGTPRPSATAAFRLGLVDPIGLAAYTAVALGTKASRSGQGWVRGR